MSARRILALWLPRLATDRLALQRRRTFAAADDGAGDVPWAVIVKEKSALRLAALDARAEAAGLAAGQGLSEARAQLPQLRVEQADPVADAAILDRIALACDRYTPLVGLLPPDGLALDISGCAHLFGGEAALRADLLARLQARGFSCRAAIADTLGAAWALVHHGNDDATCAIAAVGAEATHASVAPLPVAALRLPPDVTGTLVRLGLKTVRDILEQPRAPLVHRFGPTFARRLDQVLGREQEPISPRLPPPAFLAERHLAEPLFQFDGVTALVGELAATLAGMMEPRGKGGRRFALTLFHADGTVHRDEVGASTPVRSAERISMLFRPRLETLSARFESDSGIDLVRLAALQVDRAQAHQVDFDVHSAADAALADLVDSLSARLGPDAVTHLVARDSHQPEDAVAAVVALRTPARAWPAETRLPGEPPDRPLRLFARPEPIDAIATVPDGPPLRFRWRKVLYDVAASEGPERIAAEWWHTADPAPTRDYFRVEDTDGRRFWLFRRGLFGCETIRPAWFVHGLFC